jgi:putative ABC transport system ATP-binding protein
VSGAAIRAIDVSRVYGSGAAAVRACHDVSLTAAAGELLAIRGSSGSGKSTLLNLLGGLDRPTSGQVLLDSAEMSAMSERQLVYLRRNRIGYVVDSAGLIPVLSATENVEAPLRLLYVWPRERQARVAELLETVGLAKHADRRPAELSAGEQQRVAIARALACDPDLLIADEPTGRLDLETGRTVMDLIANLVHQRGLTAVVATDDPVLMERADRVVELRDGQPVYATAA